MAGRPRLCETTWPGRSLGKNAAEGPNDRLQADLIDFNVNNTRGATGCPVLAGSVLSKLRRAFVGARLRSVSCLFCFSALSWCKNMVYFWCSTSVLEGCIGQVLAPVPLMPGHVAGQVPFQGLDGSIHDRQGGIPIGGVLDRLCLFMGKSLGHCLPCENVRDDAPIHLRRHGGQGDGSDRDFGTAQAHFACAP
eukprot:s4866_g3.t1